MRANRKLPRLTQTKWPIVKDQIGLTARASAHASSEQSLRQARRERMNAISDEALIDLDSETAKIIAKRK
jgi:hypothetical protein